MIVYIEFIIAIKEIKITVSNTGNPQKNLASSYFACKYFRHMKKIAINIDSGKEIARIANIDSKIRGVLRLSLIQQAAQEINKKIGDNIVYSKVDMITHLLVFFCSFRSKAL